MRYRPATLPGGLGLTALGIAGAVIVGISSLRAARI
jgi:hypothetical protein